VVKFLSTALQWSNFSLFCFASQLLALLLIAGNWMMTVQLLGQGYLLLPAQLPFSSLCCNGRQRIEHCYPKACIVRDFFVFFQH
jgi:hypothetical protein